MYMLLTIPLTAPTWSGLVFYINVTAPHIRRAQQVAETSRPGPPPPWLPTSTSPSVISYQYLPSVFYSSHYIFQLHLPITLHHQRLSKMSFVLQSFLRDVQGFVLPKRPDGHPMPGVNPPLPGPVRACLDLWLLQQFSLGRTPVLDLELGPGHSTAAPRAG